MKYVIDIPEKWVKDLKLNGASTGLGKAVCKGVFHCKLIFHIISTVLCWVGDDY